MRKIIARDREEFHDLQIVRLGFRDLVPTFETPPSTKVAASLEKTRDTCRRYRHRHRPEANLGTISISSTRFSALNRSLSSSCTSSKIIVHPRALTFLRVQRNAK